MQEQSWLKEQSQKVCCGKPITIVWIAGKGFDRSYCTICEKLHSIANPRKYMISLEKVFSKKIDTSTKNH